MRCLRLLAMGALVCGVAAAAVADWDPADGHKMHFPQLPDPNGWDVEIASFNRKHECADDWRCASAGPVEDIHFWYSVYGDGGTYIDWVVVRIYEDDRTGAFSKPGKVVWGPRTFDQNLGEFTVVDPYGYGQQGFVDPQGPIWRHPDHNTYQQINIENIDDPFPQEQGKIYWLGIHAHWEEWPQPAVGWKTTLDHYEDVAVYNADLVGDGPPIWTPLYDPRPGLENERFDLAFVITPEPATLALLALGGLAVLRRRRT